MIPSKTGGRHESRCLIDLIAFNAVSHFTACMKLLTFECHHFHKLARMERRCAEEKLHSFIHKAAVNEKKNDAMCRTKPNTEHLECYSFEIQSHSGPV